MRAVFLMACTAGTAIAQTAQVYPVPDHWQYGVMHPRVLSGDGSTVVGYGSSGGRSRAMVYVLGEGHDVLPANAPFTTSVASGSTSDGRIVVGTGTVVSSTGYRWRRGVGVEVLTSRPGQRTLNTANAVSADGRVVVGELVAGGPRRAGRWSEDRGTEQLPPTFDGAEPLFASAVSDDGRTIAGVLNDQTAFLWRDGEGTFRVPGPEGVTITASLAITASGDAVFSTMAGPVPGSAIPVTWNADTGPWALPGAAGMFQTTLSSANADGRLAVGKAAPRLSPPESEMRAVYFTIGGGTRFLGEVVREAGLDMADDRFWKTTDVSDDGLAVLGTGGVYPVWVVTLPPPPPGDYNLNRFVDFLDLTDFYDCFEGRSSLPISAADLNHDGFTDFFDVIEFLDRFER